MIKNYVKITIRNTLQSKLLSGINVLGLGLGIAATILLGLFVWDELTYDQFHEKGDRIYRPWTKGQRGDEALVNSATPFAMGRQLQENYAEIEKYTVFTTFSDEVEKGDRAFIETISIASEDFFEIFTFQPVDGTLVEALTLPKSIVLTRSMAEKYFENADAAGETISVQVGSEKVLFEVTAVIEDIPGNSSIQFDFLVSDHYLKDLFPERMLTSWFMITGDNYVLLAENADADQMTEKFQPLVSQELGERAEQLDFQIHLQPLKDVHLNAELEGNTVTVDPKYVWIIGGVAALIMVIAVINFVTLSLGRSLSRAQEIAVRKSIGAEKKQLVFQFMGEALLISVLATAIGLGLAALGLSTFNEFASKSLTLSLTIERLIILLLLAVLIGLFSGIYPALVMSRFNPISIMKGSLNLGSKHKLRSVLVTGQFILSIFLITTTLIMQSQLSYLQNKNLGFDKEQVLVVPVNVPDARGMREQISKGIQKAQVLERNLAGKSGIASTGIASHTFEPGNWTNVGYQDADEQRFSFWYNTVSANFISTMDIEVLFGRDFEEGNPSDLTRAIVVNEAFVKMYGLEDPIGGKIPHDQFIEHEIIGVVKDFHIESLHTEIQPLVMSLNVEIGFSGATSIGIGSSAMPKLMVRLAPNQIQEGIEEVKLGWNEVYAGEPFDYAFVDENLRAQYENEASFSQIMMSAAVLAIVIGCLGLFGLATLTMSSRLREVSIRKVMGASGNHLLLTLNKQFVVLILVALAISAPFTYYAMDQWLTGFEYRVEITPWIFILAGVLTLLISLLTVTYQTLRTIRSNPANILRQE